METPNAPEDRQAAADEAERLYREYEEELDTAEKGRQYKAGKMLVLAIVAVAALQLVAGQIYALVNFSYGLTNLLSLLLWGVILFNLYRGQPWAKIVYIVLTVLSVLDLVRIQAAFAPLPNVYFQTQSNPAKSNALDMLLAIAAISALINVISCMLLYSDNAKAFLGKRNPSAVHSDSTVE